MPEKKFKAMLEISNLVGSAMELDEILNRIVHITTELFDVPVSSIYLFGPLRENLTLRASVGLDTNAIGIGKLPLGHGLPGISAAENMTIIVDDVSKDERHEPIHGGWENKSYVYICVPLRIQDNVVGIMTSRRREANPFSDEDRTLYETVCKLVSIVVEKSKMYFEKQEADRMAAISVSLSEVAHYIKNLLQGMKGGIYFVDLGFKRGEMDSARKGWGVLQRGLNKITSLTENMLNYSREIELQFERRDINALIYDVLSQIDDTAVERGVAILPETARELPTVEIDMEKIYDVLLNLISNAVDSIPKNRKDALILIRSHLSEDGHFVEVEIEDNGCGIPEEVLPKIFNLFFSTKGEKGTGIGLSVSRKIIEQHGGQIQVRSEVDKGTCFNIRLPLNRKHSQKPVE